MSGPPRVIELPADLEAGWSYRPGGGWRRLFWTACAIVLTVIGGGALHFALVLGWHPPAGFDALGPLWLLAHSPRIFAWFCAAALLGMAGPCWIIAMRGEDLRLRPNERRSRTTLRRFGL